TASDGTWSGSQPIDFAYQWRRTPAAGGVASDIVGATGRTYVPVAADAGSTIHVVVTATNAAGSATATSPPTAQVTAPASPPTVTAPPSISGPAEVGQSLTASDGTWSGSQPIDFAYQWRRCDVNGRNCVDIRRATSRTYKLTRDDAGSTVQVVVSATNKAGSATATSGLSTPVA
ncbi:MAG TPA: hypothetical protein VGR26_16720, partial [Acidimicrobiales bacterium]|nr:hypothetical protein [Acidimicrobiales bacterium]